MRWIGWEFSQSSKRLHEVTGAMFEITKGLAWKCSTKRRSGGKTFFQLILYRNYTSEHFYLSIISQKLFHATIGGTYSHIGEALFKCTTRINVIAWLEWKIRTRTQAQRGATKGIYFLFTFSNRCYVVPYSLLLTYFFSYFVKVTRGED